MLSTPKMRVSSLLIVLFFTSLPGCDASKTDSKLEKDYSYCLESDNSYQLPRVGDVKQVSVKLSILDDHKKEFHAISECEYKASMCKNDFRRDLWHADVELSSKSFPLPSGHELVFYPQGACLQLSDYIKKCSDSPCNAAEEFEMIVMLPSDERNIYKDREVISYSQLGQVTGVKFSKLEITVKSGEKN